MSFEAKLQLKLEERQTSGHSIGIILRGGKEVFGSVQKIDCDNFELSVPLAGGHTQVVVIRTSDVSSYS